uniref:exodeoxyribonuclease III n=1 Tax=Oryzias latipes TaxID=8090 RepID=A0A3P9I7X4_ORYLA
MANTKITTLNVKGINHVIKRVHIALLQETHLTNLEHLKLKRVWVSQIYYSSFNSKSRGVAKLIHKNLALMVDKVIQDADGRYVLVTGLLYGEQILLGSVYAPNTFDSSFNSKFVAEVSSVSSTHILIGSDFNCRLAPSTDYNPPKTQASSKMARAIVELCSDLSLFDAWRICNPRTKDFTFFSRPHLSFSRIDFLFVSRSFVIPTSLHKQVLVWV